MFDLAPSTSIFVHVDSFLSVRTRYLIKISGKINVLFVFFF
jgi:hypothetical protein